MTCEQRYPPEGLVPYESAWSDRYAAIAGAIESTLGPIWTVEHVGSTSVPGMLAKPVIDIAVRVPAGQHLEGWVPAFRALGWTDPIKIGDHQTMFVLKGTVRTTIAHVFTSEQWAEAHVRLFAAWLRAHQADRGTYARLKKDLLVQGTWGSDYTQAKSAFVENIVNRARAARGLAPVIL